MLPGENHNEDLEFFMGILGCVIITALITGFFMWWCHGCCCCRKNRNCCQCRRKPKNFPSNDPGPRLFVPGTERSIFYVPLENLSTKDDSSAYSVPAYQGEYDKGGKGFTGDY
jgi:hypothetical protein